MMSVEAESEGMGGMDRRIGLMVVGETECARVVVERDVVVRRLLGVSGGAVIWYMLCEPRRLE